MTNPVVDMLAEANPAITFISCFSVVVCLVAAYIVAFLFVRHVQRRRLQKSRSRAYKARKGDGSGGKATQQQRQKQQKQQRQQQKQQQQQQPSSASEEQKEQEDPGWITRKPSAWRRTMEESSSQSLHHEMRLEVAPDPEGGCVKTLASGTQGSFVFCPRPMNTLSAEGLA